MNKEWGALRTEGCEALCCWGLVSGCDGKREQHCLRRCGGCGWTGDADVCGHFSRRGGSSWVVVVVRALVVHVKLRLSSVNLLFAYLASQLPWIMKERNDACNLSLYSVLYLVHIQISYAIQRRMKSINGSFSYVLMNNETLSCIFCGGKIKSFHHEKKLVKIIHKTADANSPAPDPPTCSHAHLSASE